MFLFKILRFLLIFFVVTTTTTAINHANETKTPSAETSKNTKNTDNASKDISIGNINVGFNGIYKTGYWVPCQVFLQGDLPENTVVTLSTLDPEGTQTDFRTSIIRTGSSRVAASALIRLGRRESTIIARVDEVMSPTGAGNYSDSGTKKFIAEKIFKASNLAASEKVSSTTNSVDDRYPYPIDFERPIYITVAPGKIGLEEALLQMPFSDVNRPYIVSVHSFSELPDDYLAYEMVSTVVLSTSSSLYENIDANDPRVGALKKWLKFGGRVVFNAGKDTASLISGENAIFADFIPGTFVQMQQLRLSRPFEIYITDFHSENITPMLMNGSNEYPFIDVPFFNRTQGVVEVADGDLPLVVRSAYGFGQIIYIAGDLGLAPFDRWKDRPVFIARLLGTLNLASQKTGGSESQALIQLGYTDLAGQLRSASDQFELVNIPPFSMIIILLVVYLILVGIGDWFLVHRILKRPALTWCTFPCWILLFCLIVTAITMASQPRSVIINQAEVIDIDTSTKTVRGMAWHGFYSPNETNYTLHYTPGTLFSNSDTNGYLTWFGLPGKAIGSMAPNTLSLTRWNVAYPLDARSNTLAGLPMQIRSTRSLTARWVTPECLTLPIASELVEQEEIPTGHLMNATDTDWEKCIMVYGRWLIILDDIAAGETVEVGTTNKRLDIRTAFSCGRNIFNEKNIKIDTITKGYNTASTDIPYILRAMMFYQASGGYNGFGLHNSYQHQFDLSHLISTDRAVLVAILKNNDTPSDSNEPSIVSSSSGTMQVKQQKELTVPVTGGKKTTLLRMVLPVKNAMVKDR